MSDNPLSLDITGYINKAKDQKNIYTFLLDLANAGYDTYEYVIDDLPKKIKNLNKEESESTLSDLR